MAFRHTFNNTIICVLIAFEKIKRIITAMREKFKKFEGLSVNITNWIGTTSSVVVHTILFVGVFLLPYVGLPFDNILLILTTIVSLEAIYLAIFIQMSVNRNLKNLQEVEQNIDEIQENIHEISEDVDEIQEEEKKDEIHEEKTKVTLEKIESGLQKLLNDVETLKERTPGI